MRILINATQPDEVRVATTNNSLLIDLDIEQPGLEQIKSNIYKGVITSIEPSLGAVFVNYRNGRQGFLPLKEISQEYYLVQDPAQFENPDIRKILRIGQEVVVQIDKEERGTKGAALTTFITLAGSYLVLMPNNPAAGGISRRIEGDERDQLRDIIHNLSVPEGMGLIVRTAALDKTKEELEWDLKVLLQYWEAIKQAAIAKPGPYLIHQESDVVIRAIRDYLRQDIAEIIIDEEQAYERARQYINQIRPDFLNRLKLYNNHLPLFSRYQIEHQIENAFQREVHLPSGGALVIDHTEALVTIDINSARATKGGSIEETAYNTNLEAADEIARQLRLRDIGGLIVIDFIDMTSVSNQRDVENRLREAVKMDRARIQMGRISRFGLLEMSRQRLRSSLNRASQIPCPRCEGRGSVRSVESLALSILHLVHEHAAAAKNTAVHVQVPIEIGAYLLNEKRDVLQEVEKLSGSQIVIIPNTHLQSPQYHLKLVRDESNKNIPSYKLIKTLKTETETQVFTPSKKIDEPIIKEFLNQDETPLPPSPSVYRKGAASGSLIKRLWNTVFGAPAQEQEAVSLPSKREKPYTRRPERMDRDKDRGRSYDRDRGHDRERDQSDRDRTDRGDRGDRGGRYNERRPKSRSGSQRDRNKRGHQGQSRGKSRRPGRDRDREHFQQEEYVRNNPMQAAMESSYDTMEQQQTHRVNIETPVIEPIHQPETAGVSEAQQNLPMPEESFYTPPHDPNYKGLNQEEPLEQVITKPKE